MRRFAMNFASCVLLSFIPIAAFAQGRLTPDQTQIFQRSIGEQALPSEHAGRLPMPSMPQEPLAIVNQLQTQDISFRDFLQEVERSNLDYAAQRYNVSIAEAQVAAARVFPDPAFQSGYGGDVSRQKQPSGYTGSISETIPLGGKIGARTEVAQSNLKAAEAQLQDFFRNLRATATSSYIDGVAGRLGFERKQRSLKTLEQLVALNQERLRAGDIGEVDLLQSRVAALQARSDLLAAESTWRQTLVGLAVMLGRRRQDAFLGPTGNLEISPRPLVLNDLIAHAVAQRSDVVAARRADDTARAQYRLAEVSRIPDLTVGLNYQHATRSTAFINPSPAWDSLAVVVSMPIPISNLNYGALNAARFTQLQAERAVQAAELRAETDVRQAYARYMLAVDAIAQYSGELLKDADKVYEAKLYSYQRGGASLLEVLDAERATNDIYLAYYGALSEQAKSLVALEQAAGIWDIEF